MESVWPLVHATLDVPGSEHSLHKIIQHYSIAYLGGLSLHLSSTSQGAVHFA